MASETYGGVAMGDNRTLWRFFDGSSAISASMLVAVLINGCGNVCADLWGIRLLKSLTEQEAGVIILATLLLFPTTTVLYGGAKLIFAAKEAVEKKAEARRDLKRDKLRGAQKDSQKAAPTSASAYVRNSSRAATSPLSLRAY